MLKNVLLLSVACILSLLACEGIVRLIDQDSTVLLFEPDPVLGWKHVPGASTVWTEEGYGTVIINQAGFRDRERSLEKSSEIYRVAIIGDSQTAGFQVNFDETYSALLEKDLKKSKYQIEILNFGVNGYSPVQEYLLYREVVKDYAPDLVILALFLDNDISGVDPILTVSQSGIPVAHFEEGEILFDYSKAEESYQSYREEPIYTIRKTFATYRFLGNLKRKMQDRSKINHLVIPQRYDLYAFPVKERWDNAYHLTENLILKLAEQVHHSGSEFVLLSIPAAQVVTPTSWENILAMYSPMSELEWDLEAPEERLSLFAQRHELALVQPYQEFNKHALIDPESPLFFGNVGHMTPLGHAFIAKSLFPTVQEFYQVKKAD